MARRSGKLQFRLFHLVMVMVAVGAGLAVYVGTRRPDRVWEVVEVRTYEVQAMTEEGCYSMKYADVTCGDGTLIGKFTLVTDPTKPSLVRGDRFRFVAPDDAKSQFVTDDGRGLIILND